MLAYDALTPRLSGLPQQMTLKKWIDLATYYKQVRTLFNGIFLFMGLIVFFMVLMSSVNTLLMTMFERTREIGAMLAMGTPRAWIVALFMAEAVLIGIIGAVVGVVAGNLLGVLINHSGLHMPPPPGYTVNIPFPCKARAWLDDRLFASGYHLAGIRIHLARSPRIATANCGGIGPCLESTAYCEPFCCFS